MISLIFAIDKNNLIGKGNDLPWYFPEDLKYFKEITMNKTVVMGSKTFYSIYNRLGKPLPNRNNVVVTRNKDLKLEGVTVINDIKDYLINQTEEVFIIGGKQIYEYALEYADRLYITHINKEYDGDVYFPPIPYEKYNKIKSVVSNELEFAIYELTNEYKSNKNSNNDIKINKEIKI